MLPGFTATKLALEKLEDEVQGHLRATNRNDDWEECSILFSKIKETHKEIEQLVVQERPTMKAVVRNALEHLDVAIDYMEKTKSAFKSKAIAVARAEAEKVKEALSKLL
jgi:hypothetical protein